MTTYTEAGCPTPDDCPDPDHRNHKHSWLDNQTPDLRDLIGKLLDDFEFSLALERAKVDDPKRPFKDLDWYGLQYKQHHADTKAAIQDLIAKATNAAEIRGASKAAEVINKEIGVEMTLNGEYYVNNIRLKSLWQ